MRRHLSDYTRRLLIDAGVALAIVLAMMLLAHASLPS